MLLFRKILLYTGIIVALLFILVCTLPFALPVNQNKVFAYSPPFANSQFVSIEGTLVHYRVFLPPTDSIKGNIVMIHGFCGSTFSWRNNADTLAANGYRTVCVDMPGFGYSSRQLNINHAPSQNARIIWAVLDSISTTGWHIAGHSMGAAVAADMARLHPEKTKSVWFIDGLNSTEQPENNKTFTSRILTAAPVKQWAEVLGRAYFFNHNKIARLLESAYEQQPDSMTVEGYLKPLLYANTASCILDIASSAEADIPTKTEQLKMPVQIIWGTNDHWLPVKNFGKAIERLKNANLFMVNGAGHCPMETHSHIVNQYILNRLNTFL
jgi:pimeloyl-ACP methyl ester carboxylesterase